MKVVGFTALLYGRDYLGWAIRSIINHVDEHHIAYSPIGAHGHRTSIPCPETRDELFAIAQSAAGDKLRWHDGEWPHEGAQRDSIYEYVPDADAIIVLDADEIYSPRLIQMINKDIHYGIYPDVFHNKRFVRIPFIHYWRSFHRAVMRDPAWPVRLIYPNIDVSNGEKSAPLEWGYVNHMGYAQRPEIVEYKILTHGHRNEWRKDVDWFKDRYLANAQIDCHPVGSEYWNPERVDPMDFMPRFMMEHPYFHMGVIE